MTDVWESNPSLAGLCEQWFARNRDQIAAHGLHANFGRHDGQEVVAVIDYESEDVLAQMLVYYDGRVFCHGGNLQGVETTPQWDGKLPVEANLTNGLRQILALTGLPPS
jgi:hypothetical protein